MEKLPDNFDRYLEKNLSYDVNYKPYLRADILAKAIIANFDCDDGTKKVLKNTIERAQKEKAKKDAFRRKAREKEKSKRWDITAPIVKKMLEENGVITWADYISHVTEEYNCFYKGIKSTYEFARFLVEYAKENSDIRFSKDNVFTLYSVDYLKEKYNI